MPTKHVLFAVIAISIVTSLVLACLIMLGAHYRTRRREQRRLISDNHRAISGRANQHDDLEGRLAPAASHNNLHASVRQVLGRVSNTWQRGTTSELRCYEEKNLPQLGKSKRRWKVVRGRLVSAVVR